MNPVIARFQLNYNNFALDVDLQLPGSGITVLFGASGSGKTTLLRCIAGLQQSGCGFLQINGTVWQDSSKHIFLPTHKRALGYVFQQANLFEHLTVRDNICFGLKRSSQRKYTDITDIVSLLGIAHLLTRRPAHLSGGEKQRVALARALVLSPEILLMDEPLSALDAKRKQELMPYFITLHQTLQIPVIYVTHAQQEVAQLADHLVLLDAGKVMAAGPLAETWSRLDLPLAQGAKASSVWEVTVVAHETQYHLTRVSFEGGSLSLPAITAPVGSKLRIQIYASDVSLSIQQPNASSILNVLPATIDALGEGREGQSIVKLYVGQQFLLAHITCKSRALLNLQAGMSVYVQIKSTSLI